MGASAAKPHALVTFSHLEGQPGSAHASGGICFVSGGRALRLTNESFDDRTPAWSPDGRRLAFARQHTVGDDERDVFVLDLGARRLRDVTRGLAVLNYDPAWSPDGRRLAVGVAWHGSGLEVVGAEDRRPRHLLCDLDYFYGSPTWSPDGRAARGG